MADIDQETNNFLRLSIEKHEREISGTVRYIQSLEAFMAAVAAALDCLPSFANPSPTKGNAHVMRKLKALLVDKKELAEVLRRVMKNASFDHYSDVAERVYCRACGNWDCDDFAHISHASDCPYKLAKDVLSSLDAERCSRFVELKPSDMPIGGCKGEGRTQCGGCSSLDAEQNGEQ
ncbi:MAG: hypothetical protein WC455_09950 [Dehalococcoidia bacterium]|jgi:predicted Zn-ribbon and HTH transcriptional regulator